jgi:hypothetical protein
VLALGRFCLGELLCSCGVVSFSCCPVPNSFGVVLLGFVRVSFLAGCSLVVVSVPGPGRVTEASWNFVVHLLFATGLTGRVHRSDWCHRSDRQESSV